MDLSSVDLGTIIQIITGIAMLAGLVFGLIQFRQYQFGRQREKTITLWQQFQTPHFYKALSQVGELEPGLSTGEIEKRVDPDLINVVLVTYYTVGVLVHQGELDFYTVCDKFGSQIIMTWRNLEIYIQEMRERQNRPDAADWVQWLAERVIEHEGEEPLIPAYEKFKDWKP